MNRLIILDRDGVINEDSDAYVKSVDEWQPIDGSIEAISLLYKNDFSIAVATNQSGIARGFFSIDVLHAMHTKLNELVNQHQAAISDIVYCPHGPDDECSCRKPKAGLFRQISENLGIDLSGVPAVGDSLRDLQAADIVGCQPVLVLTGKGPRTLQQLDDKKNQSIREKTLVYPDLMAFSQAWIERTE